MLLISESEIRRDITNTVSRYQHGVLKSMELHDVYLFTHFRDEGGLNVDTFNNTIEVEYITGSGKIAVRFIGQAEKVTNISWMHETFVLQFTSDNITLVNDLWEKIKNF